MACRIEKQSDSPLSKQQEPRQKWEQERSGIFRMRVLCLSRNQYRLDYSDKGHTIRGLGGFPFHILESASHVLLCPMHILSGAS